MKNITVAVPDDVYTRARVVAAESGTSVSGLVATFLRSLGDDRDAEFDRLLALQREIQSQTAGFSARDRLPRDEVHERAVR